MMTDKALAILSLCALIAFLSVLVGFVQEVDLTIVIVVGVALAAYDFYRTLRNP